MTTEQRKEIVGNLFSKAIAVIEEKGEAYSGSEDTLSNFKSIANMSGMTKYEVWYVYFMKHILAISNAIKETPEYPVEKTESMDGRVMDAINYLTILQCMLEEDTVDYSLPVIDHIKVWKEIKKKREEVYKVLAKNGVNTDEL